MLESYTHVQVEAALCIWECMLEFPDNSRVQSLIAGAGVVHARHVAIALGPLACRVWDAMTEDEQQSIIPYDWEFIPCFVSALDLETIIDHGGPRLAETIEPARDIAERILKGKK